MRRACYARVVVEPRPGGDLTWAEAEHRSPHGPVRSSWRRDGNLLRLTVDVPPGTRAEIRLPDGRVTRAAPGNHRFTSAVPVPVAPATAR